ncbi:aminotransferase class I/II-fold pyridoxal phosphate-dependent enzyme [Streptomyces sp. NPDC012510]|uniref:DegT/DnrJ/EryC1/StrS aminotransferase family protein n=1 Tax=Streptomyces sp. NPDC012510 TaxID=3364838 RepID=UPI0036F16898
MTQLAIDGGAPAVTTPLPAPWPHLSRPARRQIDVLLDAACLSDYALGPHMAEFEEVVADYHDVPYVLGAASGTAALHMAFYAVGIEPGDEVIVPSYSFHATVAPLFLLSAVPVLCDVDPITGNVDLADAARRITGRTKAVVVTHMWGHPVDLDGLTELAARYGLRVIEDGSHAHGARYRGKRVGAFSDAAIFSLGARKMVSGGTGGVMMTSAQEVYQRALMLGHCHERAQMVLPPQDSAVGYGANYHLSPLTAVVCTEQYRDLDERIAVKASVLEGLSHRLEGIPGLRPPTTAADVTRGGWYGYKALYDADELGGLPLDRFIAALQAEGLAVDRPSNRPLHRLNMFTSRHLEPSYYRPGVDRPLYQQGELPGAEAYYEACLSFPAPYLHEPCDDLLDQYAQGVLKVVKNCGTLR